MSAVFSGAWLAEALIASALLIAAVLVLRAPVRRAFGPRVAYALWALPALRLALPPLPAWPAAQAPVALGRQTIIVLADTAPQLAAPVVSTTAMLAGVWAAGAAVLLLWQVVRHHLYCRAILADAEPLAVIRGVRVVGSATVSGPLAFGLWRRVVVVPGDFAERYDADEGALAMRHELAHHARGDLFANWAALVVLAVQWFNPLAWHAWRAFRVDQELAADAAVLAQSEPALRHAYASAIVKAAHHGWGRTDAACHFHSVADLKGRLKMLTPSPASRGRLAGGSAGVCLLAAAGLFLTASSSRATAAIGERVQATIAAVRSAPPVPPAPAAGQRSVHRIVVVRDGKTQRYEGAAAEAYIAAHPLPTPPAPPAPPETPRVISINCEDGSADEMVREQGEGAVKRIVTCTNRIDRVAAAAARGAVEQTRLAANSRDLERNAYIQALSGLLDARVKLVADVGMVGEERKQALNAIDISIAEIRSDLSRFD